MEKVRKPFQGIFNIIRFNWHFYLIAAVLTVIFHLFTLHCTGIIKLCFQIFECLFTLLLTVSLLVSYYVYDLSGFYNLDWVNKSDDHISVLNIHAGFDETSSLLKKKFINSNFKTLDFYNPKKHTEISIKRARKQYPPYPNTITIETNNIQLPTESVDRIYVILSAHEIRNHSERIAFFLELKRLIKTKGQVIVIEHLRDLPNGLVYNIGAFHFYSKSTWLTTFRKAQLILVSEHKHTPFISIFTLEKNGNTL